MVKRGASAARSVRFLAIDHPRRAELVDEHAEADGPESFRDRHRHSPLLGERVEHAFGLFRRVDPDIDRKTLRRLVPAWRRVGAHQQYIADGDAAVYDLVAPSGWHLAITAIGHALVTQHRLYLSA